MKLLFPALLALAVTVSAFADSPPAPIPLWPGTPPGDQGGLPPEADLTKPNEGKPGGQTVIRLGNVSTPTITLFPAPADKATGTAVLVCPGGGYNILAWDLEGTEVCAWLNSIGVTGVLLKYRVPKRPGTEKQIPPLQDAQRALSLVREHAKEWGILPNRIGILGFSAGGHLAAVTSTSAAARSYAALDAADTQPCGADFAVLIYPAYLTDKDKGDALAPELKVDAKTPPTFLAMAEDDPIRVENALYYYLALKQAKVPAELYVYPSGGHGYGLRPAGKDVTTWPARVADWLRSSGLNPAR